MFDPLEKVQKLEGIFSEFPAKTPTAGEPDGPLFGNGDIGIVAGGRGDALTFWIGKNDFWSASRSHDIECHSGVRGFAVLQICSDCLKNAFPTFFTAAARVGYCPEIILKKLKEQFLNHSFPNFFIHYGGGGIECCSAVPSCINEMLFQSHEGILRFFPAWDKKKDAAFYQLRGYDAFVVSAEIKDGVVGDIDLFSEKGRPCSVLCPWQSPMVVTENESAVKCETKNVRDGIVYMFETKPHTFYKIKPEREK